MSARVLVLNAHPDPSPERFCAALADSYALGAADSGAEVRRIELGKLQFELLRSAQEHEHGTLPDALVEAQEAIAWASHILIVFPLWLGTMPALLKGFLEQVLRPGFAYRVTNPKRPGTVRLLNGRSVRLVVTMGMPAFFYRFFYRAHGIRLLKRNILLFVGMGPVRTSLIGVVDGLSAKQRQVWLDRMAKLGRQFL
jgi:putative NADPH-quinone reductase